MRTFAPVVLLTVFCFLANGQNAPAGSTGSAPGKTKPAGDAKPDSKESTPSPLDLQQESIRKQMESVGKQAASAVRLTGKTGTPFIAPMQPPVTPSPISYLQPDCPALSSHEADRLISSAAATENVSPDILRAVIGQESGFKPCAISYKGAQGLMQLMPETARELHVANPFDPAQNVKGGAALLKQLLTRYGGDVALALGAYNAGPARVDQAGGIPAIDETENYVASIMTDMAPPADTDGGGENAAHAVVLHVSLKPDEISPGTVRVNLPK